MTFQKSSAVHHVCIRANQIRTTALETRSGPQKRKKKIYAVCSLSNTLLVLLKHCTVNPAKNKTAQPLNFQIKTLRTCSLEPAGTARIPLHAEYYNDTLCNRMAHDVHSDFRRQQLT